MSKQALANRRQYTPCFCDIVNRWVPGLPRYDVPKGLYLAPGFAWEGHHRPTILSPETPWLHMTEKCQFWGIAATGSGKTLAGIPRDLPKIFSKGCFWRFARQGISTASICPDGGWGATKKNRAVNHNDMTKRYKARCKQLDSIAQVATCREFDKPATLLLTAIIKFCCVLAAWILLRTIDQNAMGLVHW